MCRRYNGVSMSHSICPFATVYMYDFINHPHYKLFVQELKKYAAKSLLSFGKDLHTDEMTEEGIKWILEMTRIIMSEQDKTPNLGVYFIGDMMCAEFQKKTPDLRIVDICAEMISSSLE